MEGERATDAAWFLALQARFKGVLLRAAREGLFVCVPQTLSLGIGAITAADVDHHVLRRGDARGEFTTLSGREVLVTGLRMTTGRGFAEKVEAAVLSNQTVAVALPGGEAGKLHIYFLSRPLAGGNAAPGRVDELSQAELALLRCFLRISPAAEAPLAELAEGVRDLARELAGPPDAALADAWLGDWGRGAGGGGVGGGADGDADGGADDDEPDLAESPLALALQGLLSAAAAEILEGGAVAVPEGAAQRAALQRAVLLALQAEACETLAAPVLALLRFARARELARVARSLARSAALPATALGVKRAFVCDLGRAVDELAKVAAARCPLAKLQALVRASEALRGELEADLRARGVDIADVDFGADDLLPLLASLLATAWRRGDGTAARAAAADLPAQLAYIQVCLHPVAGGIQHSSFGYNLANFEQVLKWRPDAEAGSL